MLKLFAQSSLLEDTDIYPSTIANASGQLFPNTISISAPAFSYIIPFGQTQDCDIYGPLCQTGSITVGINLTTATSNAVLPCSSYLSAQAAYLATENDPDDPDRNGFWSGESDAMVAGSDLERWNANFGQSPECRSYAEAMSQGRYTFSDCGTSNAIAQTAADFDYVFLTNTARTCALFLF